MSQVENKNPVEIGKVLGGVYGSIIIFFAVLFFLSAFFTTLPSYTRLRLFTFAWLVGGLVVLVGAELGRVLFKSGVTIIGFLGFLAFNLLMVIMGLAVFADIVAPSMEAIQLVVILLLLSLVWYIVLILMTIRDWRKSR